MQGLKFFSRTSARQTFNLASFHSPHSLTWRWIVSFSFFRGDEARVRPLWSIATTTGCNGVSASPSSGLFVGHSSAPCGIATSTSASATRPIAIAMNARRLRTPQRGPQ